jgi:hypothetical protein
MTARPTQGMGICRKRRAPAGGAAWRKFFSPPLDRIPFPTIILRIRSTEGRSHETSGGRDRMRRPRAGFVTPLPGGPGNRPGGTMTPPRGARWTGTGFTSLVPGSADPGPVSLAYAGGAKPRWSAEWRRVHARTRPPQGGIGSAARRSIPSFTQRGEEGKGNTGVPGARTKNTGAVSRPKRPASRTPGSAPKPKGRRRAPAQRIRAAKRWLFENRIWKCATCAWHSRLPSPPPSRSRASADSNAPKLA